MERYIGKSRNRKPTFIAVDWVSDIGRMVVENDSNNIAPLREILATRFVDMEIQAVYHVTLPKRINRKGEVRTSPI